MWVAGEARNGQSVASSRAAQAVSAYRSGVKLRVFVLAALLLTACGPAPTVVLTSPATADHAAHDPQLDRTVAALEGDHGMTFASSGPHHVTGTDPDGNQLDFVGVPVEQVVLTVRADDAALEASETYLPFARDLLHGPGPVWSWLEDAFACRAAGESGCDTVYEQGPLTARFTDEGPEYWVVAISRE